MLSSEGVNLLSLCPSEYMANVIKSLITRRKISFSHLTLIVSDRIKGSVHEIFNGDIPVSIKPSIKFLSLERCKACQYQDYKEFSFLPLDTAMYNQMQPYQNQILACLWRSASLGRDDYRSLHDQYIEHLKFWSWYIRNFQINLYIGCVPHGTFENFIYYVCKFLAIPTLLFYPSPLQGRALMMSDWRESSVRTRDRYLALKNSALNSEVESELNLDDAISDFISRQEKKEPPSYMKTKQSQEELKILFRQVALDFLKPLLSGNIYEALKSAALLPYKITLRILLGFRYSFLLKKLEVRTINTREKYIYFPLHYQPECTTLPLGGVFENQLLAIEWLVWTKPSDIVIYVKEHPKQFFSRYTVRYRPIDFYKKIVSMPGVKLISRDIGTFDLIDNSIAAATITGTVALEAIWREKPVFLFGYHVYQYAPGVFPIRNLEDCYSAMKKILVEGFRPEKKDVGLFLKALKETSVEPEPFEYAPSVASVQDIDSFADRLYDFINTL